jgi:hypothetical protein
MFRFRTVSLRLIVSVRNRPNDIVRFRARARARDS